jgi:hypothetical protein
VVQGQTTKTRFKATFPAAACAGCPFADACPAQALGRGGRSYYFTEETILRQERHRRLQELPEERRTLRANVEATMRQFNAPCRNGKLRTRGLHAASRYGFLRAVGINFGRIYRHRRRLASPPPCKPAVSRPSATLISLFATRAAGLRLPLCSFFEAFRPCGAPLIRPAPAFV